MKLIIALSLLVVLCALLWTVATRGNPFTCTGDGWQSMDSAPRDGTVIELCNTYGAMPWYGLFRWSQEQKAINSDTPRPREEPTWVEVAKQEVSLGDSEHLSWRSYPGDPAHYVDPTQGAQETAEYWTR